MANPKELQHLPILDDMVRLSQELEDIAFKQGYRKAKPDATPVEVNTALAEFRQERKL